MGVAPLKTVIKTFADTETSVEVLESVRGKDVYILQVFSKNMPNNLCNHLFGRPVDSGFVCDFVGNC